MPTCRMKVMLLLVLLSCPVQEDFQRSGQGGDTIRFATSPRLVKYTGVLKWEDGYLEVGADYGHGEEEDYIDIRQILDNLYYDADTFLKNIKKVEVRYD